jgi:hypothetical protein
MLSQAMLMGRDSRILQISEDAKETTRSDRIIITDRSGKVRIDNLARDELRQDRKLPPSHGPTPRFTKIPTGESLPRKK